LSLARDLLARANDRGKGGRRGQSEPEQGAASVEVLAVAPALASLFPGGGLPRGATIGLGAASSPARSSVGLLLALLAQASAAGSWCAAVGLPQLGVVAASEAGVALHRLALVPQPGDDLSGVLSALVDGVELIAVGGCAGLRDKQRQALAARARARGAVLLALDSWPGSDLCLVVRSDPAITHGGWSGLGGDGHGRLRQRQAQIRAIGHGLPQRGRTVTVLLPGPLGTVCAADHKPAREIRRTTSVARQAS
jgi:hypothetical protein